VLKGSCPDASTLFASFDPTDEAGDIDTNAGRVKPLDWIFAEPELDDVVDTVCPGCAGTRLNKQARAVRLHSASGDGWSITDIARLSVSDVRSWVQGLQLVGREADIARDLIPEIKSRLEFLEEVGPLGGVLHDRGIARNRGPAHRPGVEAGCAPAGLGRFHDLVAEQI
jgi:excinuclease ABC subunit A